MMVIGLTVGTRNNFGLFLKPITGELGWNRELFSLAVATQNLVWGISQPFTGAIADRYGSGRVVAATGVSYVAGLWLMAAATQPWHLVVGMGLLIGLGTSGGFAVILGAVGRAFASKTRSRALGLATAGGSVGWILVSGISQWGIERYGWRSTLELISLVVVMMVPLALLLRAPKNRNAHIIATNVEMSIGMAVKAATQHSGYRWLFLGFFVCGFHVVFISSHLPSYLSDMGMPASAGAVALALIGGFNLLGTTVAGELGGRWSQKTVLSGLYFLRAVFITLFIALPLTQTTLVVFSVAMGLLWLGTVPLTSGLVAYMFGPRYLSTLFGIIFLGHQLGSFSGVWLGGWLYDRTGTYREVWYAAIVLGLAATVIHLMMSTEQDTRLTQEPATETP